MTESTSDGPRVVLLTGAGSGIGAAAARRFAAAGARVLLTDADAGKVEAVAAELGANSVARRLDVRSESDWSAALADAAERWGRLDALVASAGIAFARPIAEMSLEEWRTVHAINLDGCFLAARHALPLMRSGGRGGAIVFVGSASGIRGAPGAAAYSSSKAAVRMLARTLARECAPDRIRVNTVVPGGVRTPMWESMPFFQDLATAQGGTEAAWQALASETPLGRFATAEEIAAAIVYLCSDDAAMVTGSDLVIDGGYTA